MTIVSAKVVNKNAHPYDKHIIEWARQKGIYDGSTVFKQLEKLEEEMYELCEACENRVRDEKRLEIGDMYVVLTNIAHMSGLTMEECVKAAYEKISKRKGAMADGLFVKES